MNKTELQAHWNRVYERKDTRQLGWYEDYPEATLDLIEKCNLTKDATILIAGAGATTLVDYLLEKGYEDLIATDISEKALEILKKRLDQDQQQKVTWVVDDLTAPAELPSCGPVQLWCDRAVLHFFTQKEDRNTYFELLDQMVAEGGFVIIATFHLEGADRCSGLPVYRYDAQMLAESLGNDFRLLDWFIHDYTMPSGENRKYIYTLFQSVQSKEAT